METSEPRVSQLVQLAAALQDILTRLDGEGAFVAAAHVQAGLDALRSMVDQRSAATQNPIQ